MTVDPDEIRFELEHLSVSEAGRVELTGRWYGIRGRRFVRPTLLLRRPHDESQQRSLADLAHKPWAAEEGEPWTAAFDVDAGAGVSAGAAASIELSVAPDITVQLRPRPEAGSAARSGAAPPRPTRRRAKPESERAGGDTVAEHERAGGDTVAEHQRAVGDTVAEHERVVGDTVAERERTPRKQLVADRDRAIAERDEVIAVRNRIAVERDQAIAERDRSIRATARAEASLRERETALETAEQMLADERAESGRLRAQLTQAQAREERAVAGQSAPDRAPAPRGGSAARAETPHSERPRNPSLRLRANWFVRILTVLVMLGVIAAILEVIRNTIPH